LKREAWRPDVRSDEGSADFETFYELEERVLEGE